MHIVFLSSVGVILCTQCSLHQSRSFCVHTVSFHQLPHAMCTYLVFSSSVEIMLFALSTLVLFFTCFKCKSPCISCKYSWPICFAGLKCIFAHFNSSTNTLLASACSALRSWMTFVYAKSVLTKNREGDGLWELRIGAEGVRVLVRGVVLGGH